MIINKFKIIFFVFFVVLFHSACTYVGVPVDMRHPLICWYQEFPITCTQSDGNFIINYNILKLSEENKYLAEGSARYIGSASWTNFKNASFVLILIHDGVIVDTISLVGGQGNLERTIEFKKEFTTQNNFEAVVINYDMSVRG